MSALRTWNRRRFARAAAAIGLAGAVPAIRAAEPPPETKRIRLVRYPSFDVACLSPLWMAEELLHAEGFDEVSYVPLTATIDVDTLASGEADMAQTAIFDLLPALDEGKPVLALGGVHAGCFELFGATGLKSIRDLKGKTIAVANPGRRGFVSVMLAYVGLDPRKDVRFVESWDGVRLLEEGKVDATLGFPPEPQVMRARKIGAAIVNTATDRPWSQYFCCMAIGSRDFIAKHPIATKRALRAIIKAGEICATEPERVARTLVERGFYKEHAGALQTLRDIPYGRWRESDSADSLRFYALRLHEAGLVKSNPHKLLAAGTDWRFIEQIKRELKT